MHARSLRSLFRRSEVFSVLAFSAPVSVTDGNQPIIITDWNIITKTVWILCCSSCPHLYALYFFCGSEGPSKLGLALWSPSDTPQSVGLLWTSDLPGAKNSTWQHKTIARDRQPFPRRDSNPQSQPASQPPSSCRLTPSTARAPG
jgi:hypothetical protein